MANQSAIDSKSTELTDRVIFYFVDHGIQILTAIFIMGVGVLFARWVGNLIHRWQESSGKCKWGRT